MIFILLLLLLQLDYLSSEGKFYIYDWPDLVNRYANYTDRPHHSHGVEFPRWTEHYGAGRLINSTTMEYKTSQFSLFKIIYERALIDKRRTLDPMEATSFFIPFDIGMHAAFFEQHGRMRKTHCPLAPEVVDRLKKSLFFKAKFGHDHTLIMSINQNMNYFMGAEKCQGLMKHCWNCTKLSIDEYLFIGKEREFEIRERGLNWHAIPFPSDYHFSHGANGSLSIPPWKMDVPRTTLISFVGNPRRFNEWSTYIREALVVQCKNHTNECQHGVYKHDTKSSPNQLALESVFCLQPPGDMPTRKSLFDAIMSGCIPVLFHPLTGRYMYEWHWTVTEWNEIGIHYDSFLDNQDLIHQRVDFIQKLIDLYKNEPESIRKKQESLKKSAFKLQYSLVERDSKGGKSVRKEYDEKNKELKDAYEIAMTNVLNIHAGKASHDRVANYVQCMQIIKGRDILQTADNCNVSDSIKDIYYPPSLVSPLLIVK